MFLGLPLPDEVCDAIARIQGGLEGARWSPRDNLHITLRFIGPCDTQQARVLDELLGQIAIAPFEISGKGVDHFAEDHPFAMWLGVTKSAPLLALRVACERACRDVGFEADKRNFTPHITLCYLPRHQPIAPIIAYEQQHNLLTLPPWRADRFFLYNSHSKGQGPSHYTIEAEYPLIG